MSAPREYPILFSGPMVRALLDGTKTQTRRVVTDRNSVGNYKASELLLDDPRTFADDGFRAHGSKRDYLHAPVNAPVIEARRGWSPGDCDPSIMSRLYPVWEPGSLLWVRENCWEPRQPSLHEVRLGADTWCTQYDADGIHSVEDLKDWGWKRWTSRYMPRRCSRITLELTDVRVQRVQEISEEDAKAEGITVEWRGVDKVIYGPGKRVGFGYPDQANTARGAFRLLWDTLNAKRGHGWDRNDRVFALTFRRISP